MTRRSLVRREAQNYASPSNGISLIYHQQGHARIRTGIAVMSILLLIAIMIAQPSLGRGSVPSSFRDLVLSAHLLPHGKAVFIRTLQGRRILDPGRQDAELAGYEALITSPDHRAVAWLEKAGMPASVVTYPEPTVAWLFSRGHLIGAAGCDEGEPRKIRFGNGGRTLILMCGFPHGPLNEHEILFDAVTGRSLGRHNVSEMNEELDLSLSG